MIKNYKKTKNKNINKNITKQKNWYDIYNREINRIKTRIKNYEKIRFHAHHILLFCFFKKARSFLFFISSSNLIFSKFVSSCCSSCTVFVAALNIFKFVGFFKPVKTFFKFSKPFFNFWRLFFSVSFLILFLFPSANK